MSINGSVRYGPSQEHQAHGPAFGYVVISHAYEYWPTVPPIVVIASDARRYAPGKPFLPVLNK